MKKILFITIPVILISLFSDGYFLLKSENPTEVNGMSFLEQESGYTENRSYENENEEMESEENEEKSEKLRSSYNQNFEVSQELYNESMKKVMTAPSEEDYSDFVSTNFWSCIGPFGFTIPGTPGFTHTGRCMDIKFENTNGPLVATSQGGLWKPSATPICLTDNIPPLSISTFDNDPLNFNKIIIGSGEIWSGAGSNGNQGVWLTTNYGTSWIQSTINIFPGYVHKIRFSGLAGIWYMSASQGFYRSIDGGFNWTRILAIASTDFDFEGFNVYAATVSNGNLNGVWKSTNGGADFSRLIGLDAVAPQNRMLDISISIAQSAPNRIYINVTDGPTVGVYKTENNGVTWQNTNIPDHHYGQGGHNNTIAVNPVNANIVLAGGGGIVRTTNNGVSWVGIDAEYNFTSYHADVTSLRWSNDGSQVYATSDGGVHNSTNGGLNWTSYGNNLPIAQIYNIDVAVKNNSLWILGAAQDNSVVLVKDATLNFPGTWSQQIIGNDGGDVCIIEENPDYMLASRWSNGDRISRTVNGGGFGNWTQIFSHASNQEVHLDDDRLGTGAWFYRSAVNVVSYSQDLGANWQPVGGGGNFASSVFNLSVCKYNGGSVIYITTSGGNRNIWVYDTFAGGGWLNRFTGLPDIQYGKVAVHPRNNNTAYALVSTPNVTNKVFKTTNRGIQWADVSGDLQTVAGSGIMVRDLVPHPTNDNILYIGTNFGCWRTTNTGVNWHRWNLAMPVGNDIRDMEFIDSVNANKFLCYCRNSWQGEYGQEML